MRPKAQDRHTESVGQLNPYPQTPQTRTATNGQGTSRQGPQTQASHLKGCKELKIS